jgi:hypothetical protein
LSQFIIHHQSKFKHYESSTDSDIIEIKHPLKDHTSSKPYQDPSYGDENVSKYEYYSAASARPDLSYFSNVNSVSNLENSSSAFPRFSYLRYGQVKKEPGIESNYAEYTRPEYVPKESSSSTSSLIDFEEFVKKADCDFRNFIPATDWDLGYKELRSKHPALIKDLESNIFLYILKFF